MVHAQKMVVVLRINLHCDACCEEIKRRVLGIKGTDEIYKSINLLII